MQIQGQAALVTGGGSGLGEATARELARRGAKVAVLDVNRANAERVAAEIGGVACECDITATASVQAALEKAAAAHGPARDHAIRALRRTKDADELAIIRASIHAGEAAHAAAMAEIEPGMTELDAYLI